MLNDNEFESWIEKRREQYPSETNMLAAALVCWRRFKVETQERKTDSHAE